MLLLAVDTTPSVNRLKKDLRRSEWCGGCSITAFDLRRLKGDCQRSSPPADPGTDVFVLRNRTSAEAANIPSEIAPDSSEGTGIAGR